MSEEVVFSHCQLRLILVPSAMLDGGKEKKLAVRDAFCRRHRVLERSVPLFAADGEPYTANLPQA